MGKIKGKLIILGSITLVGLIGMGIILAQEISNPLAGKIIALDAGHGGEEFGAVNNQYNVVEKDVNLAVVYALRQKLGLRVSSNRGEKANDLVVAKRQKHNGMSWSKYGSSGLANVSSIFLNNESENWIIHRNLNFNFNTDNSKIAA